jgi:hypothetical protein
MLTKILIVAIMGSLAARGAVSRTPSNCASRPCQYVLTCAGSTCNSTENAELQAALNDAWRGDTIVLTAGKTWSGNFAVSKRPGSAGYLTLVSSALANLPPDGVRVSPSHSGNMPKLKMTNTSSVLSFPAGANAARYIRLQGIEIFPDTSISGNLSTSADLVRIGEGNPTQMSHFPDYIEFDRCYVHGSYTGEIRNGILGNGNHLTIRNSYISEVKMNGIETHAFVAYNGAGPFTIYNNYLEATAIPVLIGGGAQTFDGALPSDLEFHYNFFHKPLKWFSLDPDYVGVPYTNKNMLEYKIGDRSDIRWNVFDQNFKGPNNDQAGQFVSFNVRMPNGTESLSYARTQDILFANNVLRKGLGAFGILGSDSNYGYQGLAKRITLRDNLFQEIGCAWDFQNCQSYSVSFGRLAAGGEDFTIENNTFHTVDSQVSFATGHALLFDGTDTPRIKNFTYRNNIAPSGAFAWKGDGLGIGSATVNAKTYGKVTINNNVMPGQENNWSNCQSSGADTRNCSGNFFPSAAQWDANHMKWTAPPNDFKLKGQPGASPYWKSSTAKGPLGADISQLPQIRNARITTSAQTAVFAWDLSAPIASIPCVLEVSTSRNLVSKLNSWTVIADVDPVLFAQADLSIRAGNVSAGAERIFVVGKDAVESGQDRKLTPSTTYYYRLMCGGDSKQGSFQTTAAPTHSTRDLTISVKPPSGRGITQVAAHYGEKESGAPQTLAATASPVACTSSCKLNINAVSNRAQYVQLRYLDASGQLVEAANIRVIP